MNEDETTALADAFYEKAMRAPYRPRFDVFPRLTRRREWDEEAIRDLILQVVVDTELIVTGAVPLRVWLEPASCSFARSVRVGSASNRPRRSLIS